MDALSYALGGILVGPLLLMGISIAAAVLFTCGKRLEKESTWKRALESIPAGFFGLLIWGWFYRDTPLTDDKGNMMFFAIGASASLFFVAPTFTGFLRKTIVEKDLKIGNNVYYIEWLNKMIVPFFEAKASEIKEAYPEFYQWWNGLSKDRKIAFYSSRTAYLSFLLIQWNKNADAQKRKIVLQHLVSNGYEILKWKDNPEILVQEGFSLDEAKKIIAFKPNDNAAKISVFDEKGAEGWAHVFSSMPHI